jgi:cytochrome c2
VVVTLSAVFFAVTGRLAPEVAAIGVPENVSPSSEEIYSAEAEDTEHVEDDPVRGRGTFEAYCADCHHADSAKSKIGPGLAGLFTREGLEINDRPVTRESVREQITSPGGTMPAFESFLSDEELSDLVAYLETL